MRPLLLGALAALLAACGGSGSAGEPTPPTPPPALLHATAAGGTVDLTTVPVGTEAQLKAFTAQFRNERFRQQIETLARTAAGSAKVYAAVVALGCDVPPGVEVDDSVVPPVLTPHDVTEPLQECLAPVTTVAIVWTSKG